jgi:hypothetical protein
MFGSVAGALVVGLGGALSPAGRALAEGPRPEQLRILSPEEAALYDRGCDVLAPGAADASVSRYLGKQLQHPSQNHCS